MSRAKDFSRLAQSQGLGASTADELGTLPVRLDPCLEHLAKLLPPDEHAAAVTHNFASAASKFDADVNPIIQEESRDTIKATLPCVESSRVDMAEAARGAWRALLRPTRGTNRGNEARTPLRLPGAGAISRPAAPPQSFR